MTGTTDLWTPLETNDARLRPGFERMMRSRTEAVAGGACPAGWKVGVNDPRARGRLGVSSSMIGFLLDRGLLPAAEPVPLDGALRPGAELELAFRLGVDLPAGVDRQTAEAAIAGVAPAIEIIDVDLSLFENVTEALARNVWHRAAIVGASRRWDAALLDTLDVQAVHNGEPVASPVTPRGAIQNAGGLLQFVANAVADLGETLRAGDIVLSGMLPPAPVWLKRGDRLEAAYGDLGRLSLTFA